MTSAAFPVAVFAALLTAVFAALGFGVLAVLDWTKEHPDTAARMADAVRCWAVLGLAGGLVVLPVLLLAIGLSERL
jgi:hypothetical protein